MVRQAHHERYRIVLIQAARSAHPEPVEGAKVNIHLKAARYQILYEFVIHC